MATNKIKNGSILSFVMRVGGIGSLFLMNITVARQYGQEAYGAFSFVLSLVGILVVFTTLGLPTALMRNVVEYREKLSWERLKGAIVGSHILTLSASLIFSIFLLLAVEIGIIAEALRDEISYVALILPVASILALRRKAFMGYKDTAWSILPEDLILPLFFVMLVFVVNTIVQVNLSVLYLYTWSVLVVSLISLLKLQSLVGISPIVGKPLYSVKTLLVMAFPMLIGGLGQVLVAKIDTFFVGLYLGMDDAGLFQACKQISLLNTFILVCINTVAAPMLASAYCRGKKDEFNDIFNKTMALSALLSLPVFLFMIIFPGFLLNFFGGAFAGGENLLRLMAVGQYINAATGPVGFALLVSNKANDFAFSTTVVAVMYTMSIYLAVNIYDLYAVALLNMVSISVLNFWQYRSSRKIFS